ncbi:hypothetical protein ES703_65345 [subsurface metagenome]
MSGNQDAVGIGKYCSRKLSELTLLLLPAAAVVADKVLEFLKLGIGVSGEHLIVGIDIDACPFGLLKEFIEIKEVMTSYHNAGTSLRPGRDRCRHRITKAAGMCLIEHFHGPQVHLPAFEDETYEAIKVKVDIGASRK